MKQFYLMRTSGRLMVGEDIIKGAEVLRSVEAATWKQAKALLTEAD